MAQHLHVKRSWVRHQIAAGRAPAIRHAATGYYLIPDEPDLLAELQARASASGSADSHR